MAYRADIDGLRSVAIALVVLFHLGFTKGGFVGVDVFFVISGYLITGIILKATAENRFSLAQFYERRIRRLFPALFAALAVSTVAACLVLFPAELVDYGRSLAAAILFVANMFFFGGRGYFADGSDVQALHHTWSLAVEEQFYLFFPVLLAMLSDTGARRCRRVMNHAFHEFLPSHPVDGIIVAANWTEAELADLRPTVRYLRRFTDTVIVVGPVPTYDDKLPRLLARSVARDDRSVIANARVASRFATDAAFAQAMAGEQVIYVSAIGVLCGEDRDCVTRDGSGVPVQFDYGHFTQEGARFFAERLVAAGTPGLTGR